MTAADNRKRLLQAIIWLAGPVVGSLLTLTSEFAMKEMEWQHEEAEKPQVEVLATYNLHAGTFQGNIFQKKDRYTIGIVKLNVSNIRGRASRFLTTQVSVPDSCTLASFGGYVEAEIQLPDGTWVSMGKYKEDWPSDRHWVQLRVDNLPVGISDEWEVHFYYDTGTKPDVPEIIAWDDSNTYKPQVSEQK